MLNGITKQLTSAWQADLFLPDHTIRKSARARHLRINVNPGRGVEVVVPQRTSIKQAKLFLQQNLAWVYKQLEQFGCHAGFSLPEQIYLPAVNQSWQVEYGIDTPGKKILTEQDSQLQLKLAHTEPQACKKQLNHWLRKKARHCFPFWIDEVSDTIGVNYNKLSIRSQRTRWGSCSVTANISLNDRLLFLPIETVQYVVIHELCHIKHLNHSRRYWKLVETHCPNYRQHEKQLKQAYSRIPAWAL